MKSSRLSLTFIALSFVLWGLLRSLDDIVIALFQAADSMHFSVAMLVHSSFFSAYALVPLPAAILLRRKGYRFSLICACIFMAAGAAICVPGSGLHLFSLCLAGIFVVAAGIAVLQTCANPCIGLLGPPERAAARLLTLQSFSSCGSALGPIAGAWLFAVGLNPATRHVGFPSHQLASIYLTVFLLLLPLAWAIAKNFAEPRGSLGSASPGLWLAVVRRPRIAFAAAAMFLAVGVEATILGLTLRYLTILPQAHQTASEASLLLAGYWILVLLGRLLAARLLRWISPRVLLITSAVSGLLLVSVAVLQPGLAGGCCLLATGLFNATVPPTVFSLSVAGLRASELAAVSGILTTAICGGSVMPLAGGLIADQLGYNFAFVLPILSYLLLAALAGRLTPAAVHPPR
jgi:FHS family L-fucose permease-like MFS transporter